MRKLFIFFISFWVSFMVIYSIYYYKVIHKLDESVVAKAKDLPHTVIGPENKNDTGRNMIFYMGLAQALPALRDSGDSAISPAPDADFVPFNGIYNKASLEKFYEHLVTRFPNHPPMDFVGVKDGDPLLEAYFFENVRLFQGFRVSARGLRFKGRAVKALQYSPARPSDTAKAQFGIDPVTQEYALSIKLDDGREEITMYSSPKAFYWQQAAQRADSLMADPKYRHPLTAKESVLMPDIDFSILKDWARTGILQKYALAESRIKLKISPPKEGGPLEADPSYNTKTVYAMNNNFMVCLREQGKKSPYCIVYVTDPEILKPDKQGRGSVQ